MANLALVGQLKAEIDHVPVITITRVNVDENIPTTTKKGGYGVIGIAQGVADGSGSFVMSVPTTGLEINLQALKAKATGFSLTWQRGANRLAATGCKISRISDANDPGAGNYDVTVNFTYAEVIQIA